MVNEYIYQCLDTIPDYWVEIDKEDYDNPNFHTEKKRKLLIVEEIDNG